MIDVERLEHDREYWDYVAPEGATHYRSENSEWAEGWYRENREGWHKFGARTQKWFGVNKSRGPLIPRPSPAWDGSGLPPAGVECEYRPDPKHDEWQWCVFIGTVGAEAFVLTANDDVDRMMASLPGRFRPLKTEKERVTEAAAQVAGYGKDATIVPIVIGRLYDAGMLKMPETNQ